MGGSVGFSCPVELSRSRMRRTTSNFAQPSSRRTKSVPRRQFTPEHGGSSNPNRRAHTRNKHGAQRENFNSESLHYDCLSVRSLGVGTRVLLDANLRTAICQERMVSRECAIPETLPLPTDVSLSIRWLRQSLEGPMPVVRNSKSRARDHYQEAPKGRGRRANVCSRFVLIGGLIVAGAVGVKLDVRTAICQLPMVSRECAIPETLPLPTDVSLSIRWP
jgi:hypothetical protein